MSYQTFSKSIVNEAIQSYFWHISKVRVAQRPDMQMSLAKRIIRDARNHDLITQEEYEQIKDRKKTYI
jgi:ribosomal protein S25